MTEPDKFQQQILFDEPEIKVQGSDNDMSNRQQLVIENDTWQADSEDIELLSTDIESNGKSSWLFKGALTVFAAIIGIELVDFFTTGFAESPIITSLYAALLSLIAIICAGTVFKEFSGLRQLKKQTALKEQLVELSEQQGHGQAGEVLAKVTNLLGNDLSVSQQEAWQATLTNDFQDDELIKLYSKQVLSETDQKVLAEIARSSSESVVLVALSPVALLDMMIMLWRNLRLIDKVSGLYGLKLGYWGRIKLIKQVIGNMLYAGASEVVADISVDALGADLLGKLSGRLAQGLGAGMLTARLGLKTMHMCRPVPFDENAPRLSQVRAQIVSQIKQLATPSKPSNKPSK